MRTWPILQSSHPDYLIVRQWWRACLAQKTKPVWICRYPKTLNREKFYQAYIACEPKRIKGQHPCDGGVDNKRIGPERGFKTLSEAIQACQ